MNTFADGLVNKIKFNEKIHKTTIALLEDEKQLGILTKKFIEFIKEEEEEENNYDNPRIITPIELLKFSSKNSELMVLYQFSQFDQKTVNDLNKLKENNKLKEFVRKLKQLGGKRNPDKISQIVTDYKKYNLNESSIFKILRIRNTGFEKLLNDYKLCMSLKNFKRQFDLFYTSIDNAKKEKEQDFIHNIKSSNNILGKLNHGETLRLLQIIQLISEERLIDNFKKLGFSRLQKLTQLVKHYDFFKQTKDKIPKQYDEIISYLDNKSRNANLENFLNAINEFIDYESDYCSQILEKTLLIFMLKTSKNDEASIQKIQNGLKLILKPNKTLFDKEEEYTEKNFEDIQNKIKTTNKQITPEEIFYYFTYYDLINKKYNIVKSDMKMISYNNSYPFLDCVESSLLSLMNFLLFDFKSGKFNMQKLEKVPNSNIKKDLEIFYTRYGNRTLIMTSPFVNADWGKIVSGLLDIKYRISSQNNNKPDCEIKSFKKNVMNVLKYFLGLTLKASTEEVLQKYCKYIGNDFEYEIRQRLFDNLIVDFKKKMMKLCLHSM